MIASAFALFMVYSASSWMMSSPATQIEPTQQIAQAPPAAPAVDTMPTASTGTDVAQVTVTQEPITGSPQVASAEDVPPIPASEAPLASDDPDAMGAFIQEQIPEPIGSTKVKAPKQVASADTATGRVYGADNADARVVLKAKSSVWLRIEDAKGNVLITQMLNPGDTYRVPNKDGLIALSRDGGRISYLIDGKEMGPLGPSGKILVGENLDIAALQAKQKG